MLFALVVVPLASVAHNAISISTVPSELESPLPPLQSPPRSPPSFAPVISISLSRGFICKKSITISHCVKFYPSSGCIFHLSSPHFFPSRLHSIICSGSPSSDRCFASSLDGSTRQVPARTSEVTSYRKRHATTNSHIDRPVYRLSFSGCS